MPYLDFIIDLLLVSPNGESFGRLTKIKPYAIMLIKKLIIITVERLRPLNFELDLSDFLPKTLHNKPPVIITFYVICISQYLLYDIYAS